MFAIFGFSIFVLFFGAASAAVSAFEDISPCYSYSNGHVTCREIHFSEVRREFNPTYLPSLETVKLILQPYILSETFIPEDVFGAKQKQDIWIEYPYKTFINRSFSLQVDADAFRSTKNYTELFRIGRIDCTLLDLGFLSGFDQLRFFMFLNIKNNQHCLPRLPPLPKLTTLGFSDCTGINHLNIFPTLKNGLKEFRFYGDVDNIDTMNNDETANRIVDRLLPSSANTLEEMQIGNMKLVTRVPHKIPSFKALESVFLANNNISTIKSGALLFSVPVSLLNMKDNE